MRKAFLLILIGAILCPLAMYASVTGTLKGKVVDEDGNPAVGASVRIVGTRLGAAVKADGKFQVLNIPTGSYEVLVTYVGYKEHKEEIRISSDEITEISVKLVSSAKTTDVVKVVGAKAVEKTAVGTSTKYDNKQLTSIAREGVQSLVGLTAGVFNSSNGFNIRGSRTTETSIRVDGLEVTNQFTGGYGAAGMTYFPMVSTYATEEVQVLTGGFSAEYGSAMGGVVNTAIKTGRTDRYEGFLRWRTDVPALFGSMDSKASLQQDGDHMKIVNSGDGYKALGNDEQKVEFGFGGPLPYFDRATFYLTGNSTYDKYGMGYDIKDPDGNSITHLDNDEIWVKKITGRLKFWLTNNLNLTLGGDLGITSAAGGSWGWLYATDKAVANTDKSVSGSVSNDWTNTNEGVAKAVATNVWTSTIMARINHQLTDNMFYVLTISNTSNNDEQSKRKSPNDPNFFTGYDLWEPQDNYKTDLGKLTKGTDKIIDEYAVINGIGTTNDKYTAIQTIERNPLTGYIEGASSAASSNNAYGIDNLFTYHGNSSFSFRKGNYWQADGALTISLQGEISHMIKTGFEYKYNTLSRHMNSMPWDGNPFFDVYSDEWGGNLYADTLPVYNKTSKPYHPYSGALYVQDQISYKGIIFSPGLRFDYFNANTQYRTSYDPWIPISSDTGFASTKAKMQVSPRINITYPITDKSLFKLAYGIYFQMPVMENLYDAYASDLLRGNQIIGDPNMDAQRTNQFQLTYQQEVTDEISLEISAYFKDEYNQAGIRYVRTVPTPYYLYSVSEYGNARGLEFTLAKRAANNYGYSVNYALSSSASTSSSSDANYNQPLDPYTGKIQFPLNEFPNSWDRRHRVNGNFFLYWANDEGPAIAGIYPLENAQISLTGFFQSGTPYTKADLKGNATGEYNAEREPSIWSINLRFTKEFPLKDWFGDGAGHSSIQFFVDINNLLNNTAAQSYYSTTSDPDDNGISTRYTAGDFSSQSYYSKADYSNASSFAVEQYNIYGERLYSVKADADLNGVVTQVEKFNAYKKYLVDAINSNKASTYIYPRTVYVGLMFNF